MSRTLTILAVDDTPDNLITLKAVVMDVLPEYRLITCSSGPEAIRQAHLEDPDVILLDIVMPGMDGFQVCQTLKSDAQLQQIPVVFLTAARTDRPSRIRALEAGAEAFLTKPLDDQELVATVRTMTRLREAARRQAHERDRLAELVVDRTQALERSTIAQRHSEAERHLLASAIEQATEVVLILSAEGLIHYANPAISAYTGVEPSALRRQPVYEIDRTGAEIWRRTQRQPNWRGRVDGERPTGEPFEMEMSMSPIRDDAGVIRHYVLLAYDVTEWSKMEHLLHEQLDELQRWHDLMLDREDRVIELKDEVNALCACLRLPLRYTRHLDPASLTDDPEDVC